jgi:hypothetical protein
MKAHEVPAECKPAALPMQFRTRCGDGGRMSRYPVMRPSPSATAALLGAAAVSAQCVAGKATRDALFLAALDVTALPAMLVATAVCSLLFLAAHARLARSVAPATLMPAILVASGTLFLLEWLLRSAAPAAIAILVYLHVSTSASLLASGFWLIVTEQYDPHTAKRRIGRIAGAGTLGGLLGALLAERIGAAAGTPAMLLCLGGVQFVTAWLLRRVSLLEGRAGLERPDAPAAAAALVPWRSGIRGIAGAPHLHNLAVLVLLGTTSAALVDYLFKVRAVETFGPGDSLLRFFAMYHAATGVVTFVLQTTSSRAMLERCGLGLTSSTPSIALLAGSVAGMIAPGFATLLVARASETVLRGAWFRAGYELFYTPVAVDEKRAAKSVIDVGVDRLGEAAAGGLIRLALVFAPASQSTSILALAIMLSAGALIAASRLNRWYVRTLEASLVDNAGDLERTQMADDALRDLLVGLRARMQGSVAVADATTATPVAAELRDVLALRSRDATRAGEILSRERGLTSDLIHHAVPLLAVEPLADHAMLALCKVAEEHVGELGDALLDPRHDPAVRKRLARVFAVCISQRAADVLMLALEDARFDVRFEAARSLAALRDKNPRVRIDRARIHDLVLDEASAVASPWRTDNERLAHVFTLLSLVMAREPLRVAYRRLHSEDRRLRGTALEYLEGVLPPAIRQRLWPLLVHRRGATVQRFGDRHRQEQQSSSA